MRDIDQKMIFEAYLAEDETTSTGRDIIDALSRSDNYEIVRDKHEDATRMIVFRHILKPITVEVLSSGETVAFMQIKWMVPGEEFARNMDYGPDKVAQGPLTLMMNLQRIEDQLGSTSTGSATNR